MVPAVGVITIQRIADGWRDRRGERTGDENERLPEHAARDWRQPWQRPILRVGLAAVHRQPDNRLSEQPLKCCERAGDPGHRFSCADCVSCGPLTSMASTKCGGSAPGPPAFGSLATTRSPTATSAASSKTPSITSSKPADYLGRRRRSEFERHRGGERRPRSRSGHAVAGTPERPPRPDGRLLWSDRDCGLTGVLHPPPVLVDLSSLIQGEADVLSSLTQGEGGRRAARARTWARCPELRLG